MKRSAKQLLEDALAIWHAGAAAVDSERLIRENVLVDDNLLLIAGQSFALPSIRRIAVVGAGKAGAGMAAGLEAALGPQLLKEKEVTGWVNVPADCLRPLKRITLHAARPAGVNQPTAEGVAGAEKMLRIVESLGPKDLCLCLISGGGSALSPAPTEGIRLSDKQAITEHLSSAGANIQELNTVRKQLSRIKGGGLARRCKAGRLVSLIISDVIGDPLDVIASGPTVEDASTPQQALEILEHFHARQAGVEPRVFQSLRRSLAAGTTTQPPSCEVWNLIIGNNALAVDAAGVEAELRGYSHAMTAARDLEGSAEQVGRHLADMAWRMRNHSGPDCLITGGEPIVRLVDAEQRGKGGRNQQLALAALERLLQGHGEAENPLEGIAILSAGTDGEDGPTDAAGAFIEAATARVLLKRQLEPSDYLARNDAYHFFSAAGGLMKTGPTHTNVCDLRVAVVDRIEQRT